MDIKPGRPVRVGTKMVRSGEDGDVSKPTVEQYAVELDEMTKRANAASGGLVTIDVAPRPAVVKATAKSRSDA